MEKMMKGTQAMKDKMAKLRAMKKNGGGKKSKMCPKGMHMMPDGKCMKDSDMMMMKKKKMMK
jgi:hypothetical protein